MSLVRSDPSTSKPPKLSKLKPSKRKEEESVEEREEVSSDGNDENSSDTRSEEDYEEGEEEDNLHAGLSYEALETYRAKQDRAGVIYISRIPPAMSPNKVRHLMTAYGTIGRVFLQQEDPKRAYLRAKHTNTKKPHYTEGWVEFEDKKVARSVAAMLNAQPVGGKKGTRFCEDVWTMKYLPRFKWHMLTEQIAHEHAIHAARLRMELSQSKSEQKHYLRQVELGKSLEKRKRKREKEGATDLDGQQDESVSKKKRKEQQMVRTTKQEVKEMMPDRDLDRVLGSIF